MRPGSAPAGLPSPADLTLPGSGLFTAAARPATRRRLVPLWGQGRVTGVCPPAQAQGRRIVVFVVGGITRSEMRAAHKLSAKLGRPVLLGGTALDSPGTFLKRLGVRGRPRARPALARQAGA